MNHIAEYFRLMDVFSVQFTPSINLKTKNNKFSSVQGGIVSVGIYIFIFIYGIRLFQQWMAYEMPFKISTQQKFITDPVLVNYFENNNFAVKIEIAIAQNSQETYNFFNKESLLFIPLFNEVVTGKTHNIRKYYNESTQLITVYIQNLRLQDQIFFLVPCIENEVFLDSDEKCASPDQYPSIYQLPGLEINFTFNASKFNQYTNEIVEMGVYTESFIQNEFSATSTIVLQNSYYNVIKGFFQEAHEQYMLTSDYRFQNEVSTTEYFTKYYQGYEPRLKNLHLAIYLVQDTIVNEILIQYPPFAEVLASIGSIMQLLLFAGFVLHRFNNKWMIQEFIEQYKKKFFPELSLIQKNKENQYFIGSKQINPKSYKEFIKTIEQKIEEKMNYQNLIYETCRIQIVLEEITTQYKVLQSHFRNFELDIQKNQIDGQYYIQNYWDNSTPLEFQQKISLSPFTFNQSSQKQAEKFCRNLQNGDQELMSPKSTINFYPHFSEN